MKAAFVTAAGEGVGMGIAQRFARDGLAVGVNDIVADGDWSAISPPPGLDFVANKNP